MLYSMLIVEGQSLDSIYATLVSQQHLLGPIPMVHPLVIDQHAHVCCSWYYTWSQRWIRSVCPTINFCSVIAPKWAGVQKAGGLGRRKFEFQPVNQIFIELIEATANSEHILAIIRRQWGPDYILVTQNGLEIEDSPATQDIASYYRD